MLKAAGLFLLFSACLSFGFGKSHALKKRLEFLRELKKALLLLSRRDPLCKNAASGCIPQDRWKAKRTSAVFFSVCCKGTGRGRKKTAGNRFSGSAGLPW